MNIHPDTKDEGEEPSREDAAFARQLAAVLRAAEHPRADFGDRVMAAVRDTDVTAGAATVLHLRSRRSAWRRPRSVALPPLAWGALAASFAAIVSLGTLSVARTSSHSEVGAHQSQLEPRLAAAARAPKPLRPAALSSPLPAHDTVYVVRFVLADAQARTVSVVGDFNAWAKRATPLRAARAGMWSAQVALPPGRHEYAFVVDGKRWVADPAAERLADDFDTPSSVVTIGDDGTVEQ